MDIVNFIVWLNSLCTYIHKLNSVPSKGWFLKYFCIMLFLFWSVIGVENYRKLYFIFPNSSHCWKTCYLKQDISLIHFFYVRSLLSIYTHSSHCIFLMPGHGKGHPCLNAVFDSSLRYLLFCRKCSHMYLIVQST